MNIYVNESRIIEKYKELEKNFSKIKGTKKDSYSILKETVIERFLQYGLEDVKNGQYERAVYVYRCINELLTMLENSGEFGWTFSFTSVRPEIDGYSFVDEEKRPVFYCGYGHFEQVKKDIPIMNRLGCNTIQVEIGPSFMINPKGTHKKWQMEDEEVFADGERYIYTEGDFEVNLSAVYKDIIPVLERAEANNVAVCLLLSPHYVPNWMFDAYPGFRSKNVGFLKYNIYHPKAKEMLEVFIKAVVAKVKDYPSLQSICISNEPAFNTLLDSQSHELRQHDLLPTAEKKLEASGHLSYWHDHLRSRFSSIDAFNMALGCNYSDFSQINMPGEDEGSALFYEWFVFNNRMFASWHGWMASVIKDIAPKIPVHAKFMPVFGTSELPYHRRFIHYGVDPELFAEFTDISGNDAWSFEGRSHLPLSYKLAWYDFLASIKKMPVQNSEDHVIEDRDNNYEPIQAKRIYADMWQGAVHGRSATQIWVWERSNLPHASANGSILHRPDCVEAVGRAGLDINRLAPQVAALQNCRRPVAILYSNPARIYSRSYTADLFKVYEGVLYAGFRPYFLTEKKIGDLRNFDLLIVPCVTNTYSSVVEEISSYLGFGNKVILVDRDATALSKNEYDKPLDRKLVDSIFSLSDVMEADHSEKSPNEEFSRKITSKVLRMVSQDICVEEENGDLYNIEWCTCEFEGKTLVNICSYDRFKNRRVRILRKGVEQQSLNELISGSKLGGSIELEPYRPLLLSL